MERVTFEHVLQLSEYSLYKRHGIGISNALFKESDKILIDGLEHLLIVGSSSCEQCFGEVDNDAGLFFEAWFFCALLVVLQLLELFLEIDGELEPLGVHFVLLGLADLLVEVNDSS